MRDFSVHTMKFQFIVNIIFWWTNAFPLEFVCYVYLIFLKSFCISYYLLGCSIQTKSSISERLAKNCASERITDCITCSWALLLCWETLLIYFSLLGVFLFWFWYAVVSIFCIFLLNLEFFLGGGGALVVVFLFWLLTTQISVLLLTFWCNCRYVYGKVCKSRGGGLTTKFVSDIDNTVEQETVLRMKSCNLRTKINLFLKHVLIIISMNFSVNPIRKRNLTSFPHSYTKDDTKQMYIIFQCSFSKESKKGYCKKVF